MRDLRLGQEEDMFNLPRGRLKGYNNLGSDNSDYANGPMGVNLKTGSTLFSLDFMPNVNRKQLHSKSPKQKRRNVRSSKTGEKIKRKGRIGKQEDWLPESGLSGQVGSQQSQQVSMAPFPPLTCSPIPSLVREQPLGMDNNDENSDEEGDGNSPELEEEYSNKFESADIYAEIAAKTKSAGRFNKIAYPDMYGHLPPPYREQLYEKRFGTQR